MVSVCLPSDALLQHLPFYLGFSYLGRGVSLHGCSSKAQPLLLTLDEGYFLTAAPPDLECGIAPLGPPAGKGNGKPLQYSCLENPMNSMKRHNDRILKEELPRSVGAQYAMGEITPERMTGWSQSKNNSQLWM